MERFKIDLNPSAFFPVALFRKRTVRGLFTSSTDWEFIESFKTQTEARTYYETIKNLPEYLD